MVKRKELESIRNAGALRQSKEKIVMFVKTKAIALEKKNLKKL